MCPVAQGWGEGIAAGRLPLGLSRLDRVRNIHVPLLLIHGKAEHFVRSEFSEKIYANANEPKQLELDSFHGAVLSVVETTYLCMRLSSGPGPSPVVWVDQLGQSIS